MDIDPDFFSDDNIYDTYDEITDDTEISADELEERLDEQVEGMNLEKGYEEDGLSDATIMGLALSFADEIARENKTYAQSKYDVNERTDIENMKMASLLDRGGRSRILTPFEQHVDDICKGRKRLFRGD